ncbi:hypothetical protein M408DRAFT_305794 [Serendipita vermifera MAFF 305830]|uniref:Fungal-type protein kinase domain-containing protein n=1 Tax=Serendipita vermifera MAFF 305830 TaxID=933852 RepID=A0A0C2W3A6_SERVB|nr:hypothetical protein M408DRAFT_305794 [Serendipita vermifera MAFF 305830]
MDPLSLVTMTSDEWLHSSQNIYRDASQVVQPERMIEFLMPEEQCGKLSSWVEKVPDPPVAQRAKLFVDWLNVTKLDHEGTEEHDLLSFELLADRYLKGHLTNSKCRPDVAIIRQSLKSLLDTNDLHWGHLAATGNLDSDEPSHNLVFKSTSYVALHLQARPDLCMALGISIGDKHVQFFAVNACAVYYTERFLWTDNYGEYQGVLCAWMWRLYHPEADSSLTIHYTHPPQDPSSTIKHLTEPTFTIKKDGKEYEKLKIIHAGATIGRRTIVMTGKDASGNIFHRDYSEGNILLLNETANYEGPLPPELDDMCFSQYLLVKDAETDDTKSEGSRRRRLATRLLLIDFDCGEDLKQATHSGKPLPRTGTGMFMARRRLLPDRWKAFPRHQKETVEVEPTMELHYYEHRLCYEAESLFWNLLYWVMSAQPEMPLGGEEEATKLGFSTILHLNLWGGLTGELDLRHKFFITARMDKEAFHPAYSPLYDLLEMMRQCLKCDLELFGKTSAIHPEYLHDVFQRLIINFLAEHYDKPFINLKTSTTSRRVNPPL